MEITLLTEDGMEKAILGKDIEHGQKSMVLIPRGAIFAAENVNPEGYTFVSCVTTPGFTYEGFRLVGTQEIRNFYTQWADEVDYLAYEYAPEIT